MLKRGTVMHKSKLPFRYWFIAMHLLTSMKKTFRQALGKKDDEYVLAGRIELNEGYFSTETEEEKDKPLKRGRGSRRKSKVLVMAGSDLVESCGKGRKPRSVGYLKMKVIDDLKKEAINKAVKEYAEDVRVVGTDHSTSYVELKDFVPKHNSEVIPKEKVGEALPWVHIAISNAKRQLINTFHDIKPEFLQNYLDEFCYKFNRRYLGETLFGRLLVACVTYRNEFGIICIIILK